MFFSTKKVYVAPDIKHSIEKQRFLAIGKGRKDRLIVVVFTFRKMVGKILLRPTSARYLNKKEVKKYEKILEEN